MNLSPLGSAASRAALALVLLALGCGDPPSSTPLDAALDRTRDQTTDVSLDTSAVDGVTPDAATPDAVTPDAVTPDAATPDAVTPDAVTPDAAIPDAAIPDAVTPDAAIPDAATPDAATPDASTPDAVTPDGSIVGWYPQVPPGLQAAAPPGSPCTGVVAPGPAVLCVDDDNTSGVEQGTAVRPYRTISAAVLAATSGDLIEVAGGDYAENIAIDGKALDLRGGFAGGTGYDGATAGDFTTRAPASYPSTVRGVGGGAVISVIAASSSTIDGFRLVDGTGDPTYAPGLYLGGGIFISDTTVALISHNLIENNDIVTAHPGQHLENQGGGIYGEKTNLTIRSNVVRFNRSGRGAIATSEGSALIEGNAITDNLSIGDHGGGLYLASDSLTVEGNLIARNELRPEQGSGGWGAGLMVFDLNTRADLRFNVITANQGPEAGSAVFIDDGAQATLTNELIYGNACPPGGGAGIYVDGLGPAVHSFATIVNCTVAAHHCPPGIDRGDALFLERATVTVRNSIFWDNGGDDFYTDGNSSLTVTYSLSEESIGGTGNIVMAPLFAPGDFHLQSTAGRFDPVGGSWRLDQSHSPAIDAADPADPVAGEPSPNGARRNLGAYGGTAEASRSN